MIGRGIISATLAGLALFTTSALAGVVEGDSPDPVAELNTFYTKICRWTEGQSIPVEVVDITHDGVDDYLFTYDIACRGFANAFTGTAGTARQIWASIADGTYLRILDVNALALTFENREGHELIILQHRGDYCMTADAAPCFLTLEFTENQLIWADAEFQHPSMDARLRLLDAEQEETTND